LEKQSIGKEPLLAEIRPFRGVHYNLEQFKDLAPVICPPYDIISPRQQQDLYRRSEYNFVRIEYGRELPHDKDTDNKYTRAAAALGKWLQQRVLVADDSPSLYVNEHQFQHLGKTLRRREINCLVRLEEWDRKIIRPHEGTLSRPKGDRLSLLWALRADTSPIMALFEDPDKRLANCLDAATRDRPAFKASDVSGESHRLWAVSDNKITGRIAEYLAARPLYIADGHHRYESALAYQRERRSLLKSPDAGRPFDFVMMTLVDFADPGLVILPAHRLVRGLPSSSLDGLMEGLKTFFKIETLPPGGTATQSQIDALLAENPGEVRLLLCGPGRERFFRLTLSDFTPVKPMIPYFHSELYQKLDVSIVDHVILEELLGLSHEAAGAYLDYTNDTLEAVRRVRDDEYQLAVIVNPVKPGDIKSIADSGDRMPRKSTYFYPKVPAGLVLYRID
jgi:uncharacterized protein (DUF1015 family)